MSYSAFIAQIDQQLTLAKSARTESEIREALAAIRAVCDVGLNRELSQNPGQDVKLQAEIFPSKGISSQTRVVQATEKPLAEEDANGESLFDF